MSEKCRKALFVSITKGMRGEIDGQPASAWPIDLAVSSLGLDRMYGPIGYNF